MKLDTITSVQQETREIDVDIIRDIFNKMRRKSGLKNQSSVPVFEVRIWTTKERILNIFWIKPPLWRHVSKNKIDLIVPPVILDWDYTFFMENLLFIIFHELTHEFGNWISIYISNPYGKGLKYNMQVGLLNEALTDIIAMRVLEEYCHTKWIVYRDFSGIGYKTARNIILSLTKKLENQWYGDAEKILESFIQWYFSGKDIVSELGKWIEEIDIMLIVDAIKKL